MHPQGNRLKDAVKPSGPSTVTETGSDCMADCVRGHFAMISANRSRSEFSPLTRGRSSEPRPSRPLLAEPTARAASLGALNSAGGGVPVRAPLAPAAAGRGVQDGGAAAAPTRPDAAPPRCADLASRTSDESCQRSAPRRSARAGALAQQPGAAAGAGASAAAGAGARVG